MSRLEALAYSSVWVALAAGALCAAASRAMGVAPLPPAIGVAVCGTLVVYNVDRLRDLERDRATAPRRSAFVARHRAGLTALSIASAAASALFVAALGPRALVVLAPVLALGLLHRRLKGIAYAKAAYVTAAWLAVVVGLPAALSERPSDAGWCAAILGAALFANAAASNVRDAEAAAKRWGAAPVLWTARAVALLGALLGAGAPARVRPLMAVPIATLCVLGPFRPDERYGLLLVDGALLAGAAIALLRLG